MNEQSATTHSVQCLPELAVGGVDSCGPGSQRHANRSYMVEKQHCPHKEHGYVHIVSF